MILNLNESEQLLILYHQFNKNKWIKYQNQIETKANR